MLNFFRKLLSKEYTPPWIELHNQFSCYLPLAFSTKTSEEGAKKFFDDNHFIIAYNMFDEEWEEKIILEEIFKKLLIIYNFDPNDSNIIIVYKNHQKVYLPNLQYVTIPPRGVFVYDKSKLEVFY